MKASRHCTLVPVPVSDRIYTCWLQAPDSREPFKLKRFQKVRGKGVYANDSALTAVATSLS